MVDIVVELVYVPQDKPVVHLHLTVASGTSVRDVVGQSGLLQTYPECVNLSIGIFGTLVSMEQVVKAGDRIEIYRPLIFDPKEKRRQRARKS